MKIRIQFVIATLDVGGAERQLTALATGLDPTRFEVEVLVLTRGGRFEDELRASKIPYYILDKRRGFDPFCLPRLWRHMRRFRPVVVHTWMFTGGAFGRTAALLSRTPYLVMSERSANMARSIVHQAVDTALARTTDVTLGNSTAVIDWFQEYARAQKQEAMVIANGLAMEGYPAEPTKTLRPVPVLMTVCRMSPVKRLDVLLLACKRLVDEGILFRLELVGDGESRPAIEDQILSLGLTDVVLCHGNQKDVPSYLQRADIFVLTSDHEGLPNAVMEAMACHLPVVATRAGGTVDLVTENTGILVECGDVHAIAYAIRELINDPIRRKQLGKNGRQRIEQGFSMKAMVEQHERLYEQLVSEIR